MTIRDRLAALAAAAVVAGCALGVPGGDGPAPAADAASKKTMAEVLEAATPADWRPLDPARALYVELPSGRVVVELAPEFAPRHVENVVRLVRQGYFDGLHVVRAQENYVVQWGDHAARSERARPLGEARSRLPAELDRDLAGLPFTPLPDGDVYAPETGLSHGFPAARDPSSGRVWLAHCYGMVGAGREDAADSGSGAELYVVIGHSPRHLDRNVTLLGRVVRGMEHLSTLPRGTGPLGFYEDPTAGTVLRSVRVAADLPAGERTPLELLRTDTDTFRALVAARRHRREPWFLDPAGRIELCNVPLPVRAAPPPGAAREERQP